MDIYLADCYYIGECNNMDGLTKFLEPFQNEEKIYYNIEQDYLYIDDLDLDSFEINKILDFFEKNDILEDEDKSDDMDDSYNFYDEDY